MVKTKVWAEYIKILVLTRPSDNVCNFFMVNSFINYFLRAALL